MDKKVHDTINILLVVILVGVILIPLYFTMKDGFNNQANVYKDKSQRYEDVVK